MAVKLNGRAYSHAQELVERGDFVNDQKGMWSEHQPSTQQENRFLEKHGFAEYGKWYLGIDTEQDEDNKGHYKFPYGDFEKVHRCGVLSAESRAGQYKHEEIESAAAQLNGMLDAVARHA